MAKKFKKTLAMLLTVLMMTSTMSMTVFAEETDTADLVLNGETITGTITEDMVWENGDVVSDVTISDGVTITVKGTVTVAGTIRPGNNVTFVGEGDGATLIRGKLNANSDAFTGQMFYVEGTICDFPNLTFSNITLDGGAVWTGEVDPILGRGTTNEGVKATGSILYLVRANATLNNATLQNHDDGIGERANAVFLREYATVAFNNSVARNNNSPSGYWKGGVVSTRYGGTVTANNSEVYGNSASYGGFVGVSSSGSYGVKVECKDTVIRNNYASTAGAAFYLQDNYGSITKTHGDNSHGVLKLDGCTLEKNGSPDGLIYSYVYYTPAWIEDTTIADNECAVYTYGTNENRSFSVAGNTQVSSGAFDGVLYETPVRIYGELDSSASILMNRASVDYLMNKYGYLATAVPAISEHYNHTSTGTYVVTYEYTSDALYDMTLADLAQIKLPEDSGYTGWVLTDVDGNGMLDAVPVSDASAVVENVPICDDEKPGYFFAGWSEGEDGAQTATWKVARPQVSLTPATYVNVLTAGDSITLTAAVDNENSNLTYAYQWYRDNVAIEGATGTVYTATEANAGDYVYKCVVTATDANCGTNTYNKSILLHYDAPEYVCYIKETGVYYTTLTEAVADANALEGANTIVMIKDIDFDSDKALSVTGDLTIIGEQTISRGAYTGTLFTVPAGSSLTLDGGIVFDGSNNWIFDKELYENDLYNRVDNPIAAYAYSAEGGTVGTAAAFVVNGTVTANDATFRNFFSTKDSNAGDAAIFKVNANAVLDTNGALIDHNATYGANTVAHLATNAKWYIQGETMISNNFGGRNGGMCRNDSGQIYMSGGTVKDNAGKNVNGTFIMMYGTGSAFYMTGGTICGNSSVFGVNNGRCAAVYLHSGSYMKMTGGIICHNVGGSRGGIDSYAANSVLDINRVDQVFVDGVYANENGKDAYNPDNHPMVVDNVSLIGNDTHDVGRTYSTESWWVTGGIYTQDVDKFCAKGYICIPYEDTERTDDYIVVPGYRVNYYAVEEVETQKDVIDESGAVVGTEPVVELQTTLVYKYFHMLPRDKFWYEMDERANYFELTNDEGSTISTWYTEKELANIYDFDTELKSDLNLYGEWEAPYVPVHTLGSIVVNKTTTGAATPADAAFQLQKMEGNDWVNVGEAVAFSQFVDGAYTFTGLEEGTYRIVESGAEIEEFHLETTYGENIVLTKTTTENGDTSVSSGSALVTNIYTPYIHTPGTITVNKIATGAATPAGATFQLQKLNGEMWNNVGAAVPFTAFVNNAYTFTGLGEGTYRVIESGAEIEAFRLETTYGENVVLTKSIAENGDTAVNSGSILVTNTYDPYVHTLGSILVTKNTSGAATPADATFQLQKLNGETWTNVGEAVAYSAFVENAYTFAELEEGTYRIVESGAEVEGYTLETTYSANVVLTKTTADNGDTAVDSNKISVTNAYAIEEKPTEPEETEPEDNIEIPDEDVPLAPAPDEDEDDDIIEIPDEDVPLADVPKTGDMLLPFVGTAIASGAAAIFVGKTGKKKDDEE